MIIPVVNTGMLMQMVVTAIRSSKTFKQLVLGLPDIENKSHRHAKCF